MGQWWADLMLPPFGTVVFTTIEPCAIEIPDGAEKLLAAKSAVVIEIKQGQHFFKRARKRLFVRKTKFVEGDGNVINCWSADAFNVALKLGPGVGHGVLVDGVG